MAVTVITAVQNSTIPGGTLTDIYCTFTNSGGAAVTINGVVRTSPPDGTCYGDENTLTGASIAAGSTVRLPFEVVFPSTMPDSVWTMAYGFEMSDGSLVKPTQNPSIEVLYLPTTLANALQTGGIPGPGSLWFDSNIQSGLLAAI